MMKKLLLITLSTILFIITTNAFADRCPNRQPFHLVSFILQAERWVKTDTAKVIVNFNGTTSAEGLNNLHHQILKKLKQLYSTEWHITYFSRSEDKSGLEKVYARAEARLPELALAGLRKTAKALSKPGATFEIGDILFSPSLTDIQQAKSKLREELYAQAKKELNNLNKIYPKDNYQLYRILFNGIRPTPVQRREMVLSAGIKGADRVSAPMTVSQKLIMTAEVQLAAPSKKETSAK